MLVKQLLTGGGDYKKSLKQRRWAAIGMLVIGLVGFVCYFLLVPDSHLSEHAQGFYLGAASGITAGGKDGLLRTAAQMAGGLTIFGVVLSLFIVLPLSMEAYYALTGVVFFYAAVFFLSSLWLSRKL